MSDVIMLRENAWLGAGAHTASYNVAMCVSDDLKLPGVLELHEYWYGPLTDRKLEHHWHVMFVPLSVDFYWAHDTEGFSYEIGLAYIEDMNQLLIESGGDISGSLQTDCLQIVRDIRGAIKLTE